MPIVFGESIPKASQSATPILPNIERRTRPKFSLLVHPDYWDWDATAKKWLPRINKFKHDPGVQGVSYDDIHKVLDTSEAENYYRRKGYTILPNGDPRLKKCGVLRDGEYMTRLRAGRGYAYCWVWEGFEKVGNRVMWAEDEEVRRAVQEYLVDTGVVAPMSDRLKEQEIGRLKARVRRLAEAANENSSPSLRLRLTAAENLLADWELEASAANADADDGTPKKTTRK